MDNRRGSARTPVDDARGRDDDGSRAGQKPRNAGPYRLDRVVHERGLLATYRAEHIVTRHVAHVRTAAPSVTLTERLRASLLVEAKMLARAEGLRVARLLEVDPLGSFYAIEDPKGPTVRQALARVAHEVPAQAALALVCAMVEAVAVVHARGVVHAALDPSAFSLAARDVVVLGGFERARERDALPDAEAGPSMDGAEPSYTAPELLVGEPPTTASDVFSLGVIAYEVCAGVHPFSATPEEGARAVAAGSHGSTLVGHRIRSEKAPPIPESRAVPIDVERVLQRALAKQPAHRPPSAVELAAELRALGEDAARDEAWRTFSARLGVGVQSGHAPLDVVEQEPEEDASTSVRPIAVRLALVLAAMIAVGAGLFSVERGVVERAGGGKGSRGALKILAHPWAEVWLDGALLDTTPIGRPVDVDSGKHELVFKHPRATDVRRVVEVPSGARVTVEVELDVSSVADKKP